MTNYSHGHDAEKVAAQYLKKRGYTVIALNWKDKRAEIDIVAQRRTRFRKHGPLTFFEVKYRQTDRQGRGLEYITSRKLEQMRFASELYVTLNSYEGDYVLGAIELEGPSFDVTNCIEQLTD